MPDVVLLLRPDKARRDMRTLHEAVGTRRVESIAYNVDAAVSVIAAGLAKVMLCVDPRTLGDRRAAVEKKVTELGGAVEYALPEPNSRMRSSELAESFSEIRRISEDALRKLEARSQRRKRP